MSPLATLLSTWAAVYVFAAVQSIALWARRREPAQLTFTAICVSFGVYAAGRALATDARSLAEGDTALRIQELGGFAVVAAGVDFISHFVGAPSRRVVRAGYLVAAIAIGLDLGGRLTDPGRAISALAPTEPALRPEGSAALAALLVLSGFGAVALARRRARVPDGNVVVAGLSITLAAGIHDEILRTFGWPGLHLVQHAGLATVLAVGWVLLRRDVRLAAELEARTDELRASVEALRETQAALVRREQMAAVGELSAVVAHEVRNPIAILRNATSSLRRATLSTEDRGVLLGILREETDRLDRLVRDLLSYARPEWPRGESLDAAEIVRRSLDASRAERPSTGVQTEIVLETDRRISGDAELLRHALVNVIDNALLAMPGGGSLRVRIAEDTLGEEPAVRLEIRDSGTGMDDAVRQKALDPFFTTRPAGTGLGLAIVDRVVRNHHGRLEIQSAPGEGTTVALVLPAAETG